MLGTTASIATLELSQDGYLRQLRTLSAWWSLGSSALAPGLSLNYVPARLARLRAAGL